MASPLKEDKTLPDRYCVVEYTSNCGVLGVRLMCMKGIDIIRSIARLNSYWIMLREALEKRRQFNALTYPKKNQGTANVLLSPDLAHE